MHLLSRSFNHFSMCNKQTVILLNEIKDNFPFFEKKVLANLLVTPLLLLSSWDSILCDKGKILLAPMSEVFSGR